MLFTAVLLVACGLDDSGVSNKTQSRKSEKNTATGQAVSEQISNSEAFSMAEEYVKNMTLEEKVGQLFLVTLTKLDDEKGQMNSYEATDEMKGKIRDYHLGGVILKKRNLKSQHQTAMLVSELQQVASGGALYVAVEEDGGGDFSVSKECAELRAGGYIEPKEMGEKMTSLQIYQKGVSIGKELKNWGLNLNLSPVADVSYGENPEYARRCLGSEEDPDDVSEKLSSYVNGFREGGISVTLRTFPGLGKVSGDITKEMINHSETLMQLRDHEFKVYAEGVKAGADCVMVGNVYMSKLISDEIPAFMSSDIVTKLLREEIGFERVVMTSPLNESAITNKFSQEYAMTEALKAGCDILVQPDDFEEAYHTLLEDVRVGRLNEKVINTAVCRIITNKIEAGILVLEDTNQ